MKRRQRGYVPTRKTKGAPADTGAATAVRPTVATIDMSAGRGRAGIATHTRVTILGTGLYAGEVAVVERLVNGAIPAAVVRTRSGHTRHVRTIDLEPVVERDEEAVARA